MGDPMTPERREEIRAIVAQQRAHIEHLNTIAPGFRAASKIELAVVDELLAEVDRLNRKIADYREAIAHARRELGIGPKAPPPDPQWQREPKGEGDIVSLPVCVQCLRGEGSECHNPGCIYWLKDVPKDLLESPLASAYLEAHEALPAQIPDPPKE